jgi:TusE/DsrC/DsvC family sulfur relay protein
MMGYMIDGVEFEYDEEKFLLEPNYNDEAVKVIAAEEGITLNDDHWLVVEFLRSQYKEHGHTPNFRNFLKEIDEQHPGKDWKKLLYDSDAAGAASSACGRPAQALRQGRLLI